MPHPRPLSTLTLNCRVDIIIRSNYHDLSVAGVLHLGPALGAAPQAHAVAGDRGRAHRRGGRCQGSKPGGYFMVYMLDNDVQYLVLGAVLSPW